MQVWAARSAAKKNQLLMEEWLTGKDKYKYSPKIIASEIPISGILQHYSRVQAVGRPSGKTYRTLNYVLGLWGGGVQVDLGD